MSFLNKIKSAATAAAPTIQEKISEKLGTTTPINFYNSDVCPYGQRTYIALLEKEKDPRNPVNFKYIETNLNDTRPENTVTQTFRKISPTSTVPTIEVPSKNNFVASDSLPLNEYIEKHFASPSLLPESLEEQWHVRYLIAKHANLGTGMVGALTAQDEESVKKNTDTFLEALRKFNEDIKKSKGLFLVGSQFTLADIAFVPFIERAIVILGHYRGFVIPKTEEYNAIHSWYAACQARESVKITQGPRSVASLQTQPYESTTRNDYLIESALPFALGAYAAGKALYASRPPASARLTKEELLAKKAELAKA